MASGLLRRMPLGEADQVVEAARSLEHAGRGDDRRDHEHHVDGRRRRLKVEDEGEDGQAYAAHHAESDSAQPRADEDGGQDHDEFEPEHGVFRRPASAGRRSSRAQALAL
jgi:hypothetical protein